MGAATSMIARAELRRRWGSFLGVAALIAIVTAALLTALVGAQRSATAVDRFRERTGASDVLYQSSSLDEARSMVAAARSADGVEHAGLRYLVNVWPTDGSADIAIMSDPDGVYGTQIDRLHLLEGRLPDEGAPDEIVLNELAAQVTGLHVGDHIDARSWSSSDLSSLSGGNAFPGFGGPHLDLVVVGVGRTADELSGSVRRTSPYAIGSPAFLADHPDIGAWPPGIVVRMQPGASTAGLDDALSQIQAAAAGVDAPGGFHTAFTAADDVYLDAARRATQSLVVGLLVFAAAVAIAGGLAIGQAVQRQLAGSATPPGTLTALGLTRGEMGMARSLPVALSAGGGILVGVALAVVASPLLPIGLVRRAEVDPGVWVDPLVLAAGGAAILVAVWVWALLCARRQARVTEPRGAVRRVPFAARLAARASASPAVATGVRMAGDRGRSGGAIPVRSAFLGVALAVTGLLAAGVVVSSYRELAAEPAHWGIPWSSIPDYFGEDSNDDLIARLQTDDRVDALARYTSMTLVLDGQVVSGASLEVLKGEMAFTRLEGRLPVSPTEVALGAKTMATLGVAIGDTVAAVPSGGGEPVPLTVVGSVVFPATDEYAMGIGAVVTPAAVRQFGEHEPNETTAIRFAPGADVAAVEAGLAEDHGLEFNIFTEPRAQGSISSLADTRDIVGALAGFLAVLAVVGMVHALLVSTRRRRHELGVLRAMGLRGRQAARAVVVEALTLTLAGVAVGIPAGLIVGRAVWRLLVADLGAVADPQWPWLVLVVVVPVAALIAAALSWWPAWRTRVLSPASALRVE